MKKSNLHSFHIPVLGIGFSIDTPIKVVKYGINSVISLVDDGLMEQLRKHYSEKHKLDYRPVCDNEEDSRAKRITAYLNLVNKIAKDEFTVLKNSPFEPGSEITKYFELLRDFSASKILYEQMLKSSDKTVISELQKILRKEVMPGSIDVNIMTKLDKPNYDKNGEKLPPEFNDAHAALRGFAESDLESSIVFSAGMNPRLYSYL